jgi:hypothetical protein
MYLSLHFPSPQQRIQTISSLELAFHEFGRHFAENRTGFRKRRAVCRIKRPALRHKAGQPRRTWTQVAQWKTLGSLALDDETRHLGQRRVCKGYRAEIETLPDDHTKAIHCKRLVSASQKKKQGVVRKTPNRTIARLRCNPVLDQLGGAVPIRECVMFASLRTVLVILELGRQPKVTDKDGVVLQNKVSTAFEDQELAKKPSVLGIRGNQTSNLGE